MKIVLFFDQVQAGLGGKERPDLPLGIEKGGIGAAHMLQPHLDKFDAEVVATLYCGDGYFQEDEQLNAKKLTAMVKKIGPDAVICGPAYNYKGYAHMAAVTAQMIQDKTDIPVLTAMSDDNSDTISQYKDKINIVKMPKKGGTGLNQALENIVFVAKEISEKKARETFKDLLY